VFEETEEANGEVAVSFRVANGDGLSAVWDQLWAQDGLGRGARLGAGTLVVRMPKGEGLPNSDFLALGKRGPGVRTGAAG